MVQTRRAFLGILAGAGISLSGCSSTSSTKEDQAEIVAGPGSALSFDPTEVSVLSGETITWFFDSSGHNVSAVPADSGLVSIPEAAEPFSSYEDAKSRTVDRGETFSHRFEVSGTYKYVCIPHASAGMVGTIQVPE